MAATGQHGAIGVVDATRGEVFAKGADGQMRRLAVGDKVYEGDVIVTANGSTAEIAPFNGPVLHVQEQQTVAIDAQVAAPAHEHDATAGAIAPLGSSEAAKVIQTVGAPQAGQDFNATLDDDATAAGLTGGDGAQGGHNFVDLMRIIEAVPTVGYDFPTNPPGTTPIITGQSATPITNTPEAPPAEDVLSPVSASYEQTEGTGHTYTAAAGTSSTGSSVHFMAGTYVGSLGHSVTIDENGVFTYDAPVGDDRVARNEVFTFKTMDAAGSQSTSTVTIDILDTVPVAHGDYSGLAMTDAGQMAHGNVMFNDIPNVDAPVHVTAVNGNQVSAEGTTSIHGTYGTLTIDANGQYSYVSDGVSVSALDGMPMSANVAMYGTDVARNWSLNINDLGLGSTLVDGDGVAPIFAGPSSGFGVDARGLTSMIDPGESLIFSLDHVVNSVTVSLAGSSAAAHWFAYGENGALIGQGGFVGSSANISETTAIKTLVVHNDSTSHLEGQSPSFYVTSVAYHGYDAFRYSVTDSDGSSSSAWLLISPDSTSYVDPSNGDLFLVGTAANDLLDANAWQSSGWGNNDVLVGGAGNDILTGGTGADTFVWHLADAAGTSSLHPALDTITDFSAGDVLELNDLITPTAGVTVVVDTVAHSTTVTVTADATHVQEIQLAGYEAANPTDMAAQLKTTTHFTG